MTLKQVTEALVFASQKPMMPKEILAALKSAAADSEDVEIQTLAKAKEADIVAVLGDLQEELVAAGRSFQLVERVNGWQLVSDPKCALWVRQLYPESKPTRLSGPALETLAIIAYRQPIMRADIEAVRGVAVDGVVQSLLERSLIRIAGRADIPGRPLLYETTEVFLSHFGLKSVDELPNAGELRKINLPTAPVPEEKATPEGNESKPGKGSKSAKTTEATEANEAAQEQSNPVPSPSPEDQVSAETQEATSPEAASPEPVSVPELESASEPAPVSGENAEYPEVP